MDNLYDENINEETLEAKTEEVSEDTTGEEPTEQLFDEEEGFFGTGDKTYVKKADKYDDVRSSAFTMLIVGMLGIIFVILSLTQVIVLPFAASTAWLFYTIMSIVFIAFVVGGIISFIRAKGLEEEAEIENQIIDEINEWAKTNLTQENIDVGLNLDESVEILYFSRADRIKSKLMHQYEEVDEGLIDLLTENIYTRMYEDDEAFDEEYDYEETLEDTEKSLDE